MEKQNKINSFLNENNYSLNIKGITKEFYAQYCCVNNLDNYYGKISFIKSEKRNSIMKGYGCKFLLYGYVTSNTIIIAYSPVLENDIKRIKSAVTFENVEELLTTNFHKISKRTLMIFDKKMDIDYSGAKILNEKDYAAYEVFFRKENPNSNPTGWLKDYFLEKTKLHYFVGYYKNDELVCVCDAPDMPYMENIIQHTGISTLPDERRKGYAKKVCALAVSNLINQKVCPQWDTNSNNLASINLAKSIGFRILAKAYILEDFD